ncbi:MAG: competence/damage-inducible protein A [Verrucomicrobiae bacterium]|nr:competence/damage-inducible protein A [Verrucomicrobiae bacterium]
MKVEIINTGTELLLGAVVNTHQSYMARALLPLGLTVQRQVTVGDDPLLIRGAFAEAIKRAGLVIATGGLGPTSDDITRDVVADLTGRRLVFHQEIMDRIEARFRHRRFPMPASVRVQAMVPEGAIVLTNNNGTAPGLALEHKTKWLILLPGPPRELKPMFEDIVLPLLREKLTLPIVDARTFRTCGIGESMVEEIVGTQLLALPGCEVGYCARPSEVDVRIVVRAHSQTEARAMADRAEDIIRQNLREWIFGTGEDRLEAVIVKTLAAKKATLAVAESCTGGLLAHRITNVPGSSEMFVNGCVTYTNASKTRLVGVPATLIEQHGAVSDPVARAMAEGVRTSSGTDYGIGITGIAGPSGGTTEKPIGLVYIALATPTETRCIEQRINYDRETFKFVATQYALDLLRRANLNPAVDRKRTG